MLTMVRTSPWRTMCSVIVEWCCARIHSGSSKANDVAITNSAALTATSVTSGGSLPIQTPGGNLTAATGHGITIPTRRPDLSPTTDLARCQAATASSFVPGDEPVAAVDGSTATPWVATDPKATLTVHLAKTTNVGSVTVTRGTGSFSYTVQTSTDGQTWHTVATAPTSSAGGTNHFTFSPLSAAYVRLDFPGGSGAAAPEIDELEVGTS